MLSIKRTSPLIDRHSQPIADALLTQVVHDRKNLQFLEIASGTGQLLGYLAPIYRNILFQPSEYDRVQFASIKGYVADCPTKNILDPVAVDICDHPDDWPSRFAPDSIDYMMNTNMVQVSPWKCAVGLFRAAGILLKPRGKLFTYGPYGEDGEIHPLSAEQFDKSLKIRNPDWGVRDVGKLRELAHKNGLKLTKNLNMLSNTKLLTWTKM